MQIANNDPNLPLATAALTGVCVSVMPVATLSAAALDFGTVLPGGASTRTLRLSNSGTDTLVVSGTAITGADASSYTVIRACGNRIPPGASDSLDLRFAPGATGVKTAALQIASNDPNLPIARVGLTGVCSTAAPVISLSETALDFGTVTVGSSRTRFLTIRNSGSVTLTVSRSAIGGADSLGFVIVQPCGAGIAPGGADSVGIRFMPTAARAMSAQLALTSNDPVTPLATVQLTGLGATGVPHLAVSDSALDFGVTMQGYPVSRTLVVSNTGTGALNVSGCVLVGADRTQYLFTRACASRIEAGARDTVRLHFDPTTLGIKRASIGLTSDDPVRPSMQIALNGICATTTGPRLVLGRTLLDFGSVPLQGTKDEDLSLQNTGSADVRITQQSIGGANWSEFSIAQRADSVLAPGGSTALRVRHAPVTTGSKTAVLRLQTNDAAMPTADIALISIVVGVDAPDAAPRGVVLRANYPNPFHPVTTMTYELAGESVVDLALYSAIGMRVLTVDCGLRGAGVHVVSCDAGTLPAGAYTALLVATDARGHRGTARIGLLRVR
ncbi:MAG: choice-of-anchor D domain-containing protein [Ignavibacteria bacterium]|nr:choice-of-anchor D domain-containing protein [Ignavibacteria bacterium]